MCDGNAAVDKPMTERWGPRLLSVGSVERFLSSHIMFWESSDTLQSSLCALQFCGISIGSEGNIRFKLPEAERLITAELLLSLTPFLTAHHCNYPGCLFGGFVHWGTFRCFFSRVRWSNSSGGERSVLQAALVKPPLWIFLFVFMSGSLAPPSLKVLEPRCA